MKKTIIGLSILVLVLTVSGCGSDTDTTRNNPSTALKQEENEKEEQDITTPIADSHDLQETQENNTPGSSNIDMPILDEIEQNIQPGTTGSYMTTVQEAVKMLDWGTGTGLDPQEIKDATAAWLTNKGNDEQVSFLDKLKQVDDAYQKLLGEDAEELLESAGLEDTTNTWGNLPIEPIEAVMEAAGLRQ